MIFEMDGAGVLTFREEHPVGWATDNVEASPDGRVVVFGAVKPPYLTVFFVKDDGSVTPPVYADAGYQWSYWNPIAFNANLPLFYAGFYPSTVAFRYDQLAHQVQPTSQTVETHNIRSLDLCYSSWANGLYFLSDESQRVRGAVQSVWLKADGRFGDLSPLYASPSSVDLGENQTVALSGGADFTVSPDGRWAVLSQYPVYATGSSYLTVLAITPDGSLAMADLVQLVSNNELGGFPYLIFSPDSHSLYLLSDAPKTLIAFDVNPNTGKLTERSAIMKKDIDSTLSRAINVAISPDGRYLAFHSQIPTDAGRKYIHVVRVREDGQLEYLRDRRIEVDAALGDLAFTWRPHDAAGAHWALYE